MKQSIGFCQFVDAFRACGRENQFSYAGKRALFDYLEEMAEDTGEEYCLDIIALCCEFSEYASATCAWNDINSDELAGKTAEEREETALRWLRKNTEVIEFAGGIIFVQF